MEREGNLSFQLLKQKLDKTDIYFDEAVLYIILKLLYAPPDVSRVLDFRYGMHDNTPYKILLAFLWLYVHYNLDISSLVQAYQNRDYKNKKVDMLKTGKSKERLDFAWEFFKKCYPESSFVSSLSPNYNHLIGTGDGRVQWGQMFNTPTFPRSGKNTLQKDLQIYLTKFRNDELLSKSTGTIIKNYTETMTTLFQYLRITLYNHKKSELILNSRDYYQIALGQELDLARPAVRIIEGIYELQISEIVNLLFIQDETYASGAGFNINFRAILSIKGETEEVLKLDFLKRKTTTISQLSFSFDSKTRILKVGDKLIRFQSRDQSKVFPVSTFAKLLADHYPYSFSKKEAYKLYTGSYDKGKSYEFLNRAVKIINKRLKSTEVTIRLVTPNVVFDISE